MSPHDKPRSWLGTLLLLLLLPLTAAGIIGGMAYSFLSTPGSLPPTNVLITIPSGRSFAEVAQDLEDRGVITSARKFDFYARYRELTGSIKSGRFMLNTGWTPPQVLEYLVNGMPYLEKVTIPEGLTWWETGRRLEAVGMVRFEDFSKVVHDPEFLRFWGIPFRSAEGFLFPDTYLFIPPLELNEESARVIAGRMVDNFWRRTGELWPNGQRPGRSDAGLVRDRVRLASIVEKETSRPEERPRVAGVYVNRLQKGMMLQADPTIIYGLGPSFQGAILKQHISDNRNLYNTYRHRGLPPGPICSPGLASLKAAFAPEQHDFLYFVATGEGGSHSFSTNLRDHNQAVKIYRQNTGM